MIVKSYTAPTVAAALKEIREELGGEAIVLRTRISSHGEAVPPGHRFEVTACVDEQLARSFRRKERISPAGKGNSSIGTPDRIGPDKPAKPAEHEVAPARIDLQKKTIGKFDKADEVVSANRLSKNGVPDLTSGYLSERLKPIYMSLIDSDVPAGLVDQLAAAITEYSSDTDNIEHVAYKMLRARLAASIATDVRIEYGSRIAFTGPSGAGKTSALGKVAALLCAQYRQKIKLVSVKHKELPTAGEIEAYGAHLDVSVETPEKISHAKKDDSIVLIDTPPISRDGTKLSELVEKTRALNPDVTFLIFSASMRTHDLVDAIKEYKSITPDYLIATHLDETWRWGNILAMTEYLNIPLAFITDSPGGTGHLMTPDPAVLARQLLKLEGGLYD